MCAGLREAGVGAGAEVELGDLETVRRPVHRHGGWRHLHSPPLPQLGVVAELQPFGRAIEPVDAPGAREAVGSLEGAHALVAGTADAAFPTGTADAARRIDEWGLAGLEVPDL